ncbi:MAG: S41 family peptidase [Gammaproteobacteria bacterium]|nr:S41 family peptidase [Gammaproteobacteria bacterium]
MIRLPALFFVLTLLQACDLFDDSDSMPGASSPASCADEDYNQYVYDSMKRYYFWYDTVDPGNSINPRDMISYPTPTDLLDALKYSPTDRFSHIGDAATFNQFFGDGVFLGTGLRLITDDLSNDVMVAYAFDDSPAYIAGIRRGDQIVSINGITANGLNGQNWSDAWGADEIGTEVELLIRHTDSTEAPFTVTKDLVSIYTTQKSNVMTNGTNKIGYLHFTHFLGSRSVTELNTEFQNFKNNQVTELIVDLRYNGGGSVNTARHLGSLIGGSATAGNIFTRLIYNDNPNGYNGFSSTLNFQSAAESLNLSRVFFITTAASCSASELVINALLPSTNIQVVVIGSTSCGKPAGSVPDTACGKTLSALNFEIRNANDEGGYYNGIGPGFAGLNAFCEATDNIGFALGDSAENSIASAIDYINTGACNADFNKHISYRNAPDRHHYTAMEALY